MDYRRIICSCTAMGMFFFAQAQDKKSKDSLWNELDEVVVSYNKWEQNLNEVPNKIARINMKLAALQHPQTAADLLGASGSVFIQKSQMGGGSPMIRGFATNRVLIVVDGVRMNNAIYRSGNLQNVISLDALATENAEVIFGPGSLIYGSDAIGGVMDFHSFTPKLSSNEDLFVKANVLTRYASANKEKTVHADVNFGEKKISFLSSFTYSDFGDMKMGKNGGQDSYLRPNSVEWINGKDSVVTNPDPRVQLQSGYHQLNLLQKIRIRPNDHWDLGYAYHYSATGNVPRYDRLIETSGGLPTFAQWYYGPQRWEMHQAQAAYTGRTALFDNMKAVFAYQDYEESRHDRRRNNANLRNLTETVEAVSANFDFLKMLDPHTSLFYGAEYVFNEVGSTGNRVNTTNGTVSGVASRYPNGSKWQSAAAYISLKKRVNPKLVLSTGLRYNHVSLKSRFDTTYFKTPFLEADISKGALTGNIGITYRTTENSHLFFNVSTGFRSPNVDDIGKIFESVTGRLTVPNANLSSEYAWNGELGWNIKKERRYSFDITAFFTYLDNAIARRAFRLNGSDSLEFNGGMVFTEALQNVAHAKVWGVQGAFSVFIAPRISWSIQGNWTKGEETDDAEDKNVPLRHAAPFFGNSHLRFMRGKWLFDLYGIYNAAIRYEDLAPTEQVKTFIYAKDANGNPYSPSWYTINLKGSCEINRHISVSGGWENMTNQRYRPYSSGIVAAGSNLVLSVKASI
ncbi:TonB-dependent receptor [Parasegetibacter sp. NRK P23]|uniref:TonB-dependent receptor n=1 Tax=Parasegetibacter sp. NRK P23 TaxID=2942999 RepID=UPI002043B364|nr:TonB-dependent receptor [Parasegetibacter sp. NRK P23]MCM5527537.1 TonB-dependent receptor [Parasegetibacter sp. NRK P23]